jgi:hypothetical protein
MAVSAPVHEFAVYMEIVASVLLSTYANVGRVAGTQVAEGPGGVVAIRSHPVAITMSSGTSTIR